MKRLICSLLCCLTLLGLSAKGTPGIEFKETSHDFGNVKQNGGPVEYVFTYTNTGTAPLVLTTVSAPCNCTKTKWSPNPLGPGKKGEIKVVYTPDGNAGEFMRTIQVWTNVKAEGGKKKKLTLNISGTVIPAK